MNDWVRSHVERLLQDEWGRCRVERDEDGDYPFRDGTAACWVSVLETDDVPYVRVFAHAAHSIKPTAALFRELNDIQLRTTSCSVMWSQGEVIVAQTISPIGLTRPVLAQALHAVGGVAADIGLLLALSFHGATPFAADTEVPHDEQAS